MKAVLEAASHAKGKRERGSFGLKSHSSAVLNRCLVGAPGGMSVAESMKFSSATQHIPTGAARGGGLIRGTDKALEGADGPRQTGLVTLSPQQIFAQKLLNKLHN